MRTVEIFDTTLRDGEQSAGVNLHEGEKLEIALQLERMGVNVMEVGFPASSRGDFQSVKRIADTITGSTVTGLARSVKSDIDATWEAIRGAAKPRIHLFIATSPIHMEYKLKMEPDQVVERAVESIRYAAQFFPEIQWSAEDATRSEWPFLARIIEEVINAGASVINLPDTVGYTTPKEYAEMFRYLLANVPNLDRARLSSHCHDDLGLAVANSLSAIEAGVGQVECTINGIGERAGNASLEEIAVALAVRKDIMQATTTLDLTQITRTSRLVSKLTGMVVAPNKAVVGANAFAHESGIHQDGVLKNKQTYEIIEPEMVGLTSNVMVLGKHSGRHAFANRCEQLGITLKDDELNELFKRFKELTDRRKNVSDEDLLALVLEVFDREVGAKYELEYLHVSYGTQAPTTATIGILTPEGELLQEAATGNGSVEGIFNTITRLFNEPIELLDYRIQSTTSGVDSLGEVYVQLNFQGHISSGRGVDTDVLCASAKAFLDAINRIHLNGAVEQVSKGVNV